jgi:hypothetical protein
MAEHHTSLRFDFQIGDIVKRWVVLTSDGTLEIQTTSGFEPPGMLCRAHDDWVTDEISYVDGIVFVDPAKVKAKRDKEIKIKWEDQRDREWREFKARWKVILPRIRDAVIAFAIGLFLGKVI